MTVTVSDSRPTVRTEGWNLWHTGQTFYAVRTRCLTEAESTAGLVATVHGTSAEKRESLILEQQELERRFAEHLQQHDASACLRCI